MRKVSTPGGGRMQFGIPRGNLPGQKMSYLVRGVVMATYVPDDPNYPGAGKGTCTDTVCDVLVYTSLPGGRFYVLRQVLVTPDATGLQGGNVYKPRATTANLNGAAFGTTKVIDPSQLDGDHVLVAFIDGDRHNPVIVRFLPHPSKDAGNGAALPAGARQALRLADGDPSYRKHHGAYYGISTTGDVVMDTTLANDGTRLTGGAEPPAGATGTGNNITRVGKQAQRITQVMDATVPAAQIEMLREALSAQGYDLNFETLSVMWQIHNTVGNALKLAGAGPAATLTIGTGAVHAAVGEAMQTWWESVVVPALAAPIPVTGTAGTVPVVGTATPAAAPAFDPTIISGKLAMPSG